MDNEELLSRKMLERALDNLPANIWIKDTDSKHLFVNKSYCNLAVRMPDLWQYTSKDKILGKTDPELFGEKVARESFNQMTKADSEIIEKGTGLSRVEVSYTGHDGLMLTYDVIKAPVKDDEGKVTLLAGIMIETTDQKRMQTIAKIKENLRELPGLTTGMELILDTALQEFDRDTGVILLIDRKMNSARVQAFKSKVEGLTLDESYPLDGGFTELKILDKGGSFSNVVKRLEPSILGTTSVSCVPVYLFGKLYGILALGDVKGRTLEREHLDILELYGDLVSTVFETETLTVKPIKEKVVKRESQFKLEPGYSYLIKGKMEKAFEIFTDQVFGGFEGLCFTREIPSRVRQRYGLENTPLVWLRKERVENETAVYSLEDLSFVTDQFLKKAKHGVVLLDGFEYLVVNHGFESCIQFLQLTRSKFEEYNGTFIIPILEGTLEEKQFKLLERETKPFKTMS